MAAPGLEKGQAGGVLARPPLGQQHEAGAPSGSWGLQDRNWRLLRQQRGRGRRKKEASRRNKRGTQGAHMR